MTRFEIIVGFMFANINQYIDELYYAKSKDSLHYYQLINNIITNINRDLEEELLEPLNSDERKAVIQEIEHILNQF